MMELVQRALAARGIEDELLAVGEFNPRGHSGGMFVGGLAGGDAGGVLGGVGEGAGIAVGSMAGMRGADALSGLPELMLVGVSATTVYGFAAPSRRKEPAALAFQL